MAVRLGAHSARIAAVRALASGKGRREQSCFAFEGPTLLAEALRSGIAVNELYATEAALDASPAARELDAAGTPVFLIDERAAAKISTVEAPTGLVAVAPLALRPLDAVLAAEGLVLLLADVNDPGNAGTLVRSADAFGAAGVAFGSLGVDPYHPKVVRAAMGSLFRVPLAVADPAELFAAAQARGRPLLALAADGSPLDRTPIPSTAILLVGHERRGLGRWETPLAQRLAIPMRGDAESLNAAVAGSIALYQADRSSRA